MRIVDLSQPVFHACPNCPAHRPVNIELVSQHGGAGETWHLEELHFATHTGSHVDAPLHKIPGGNAIDGVALERWAGRALIVDLRGIGAKSRIEPAMLERAGDVTDAWVLLATGWGQKRAATPEWLHEAPELTEAGARWLVEHGARGVGIDHWSIGGAATHALLLQSPVLIVEELYFSEETMALAKSGITMTLMALPINVRGASGAPCRPVLLLEEQR